MSGNDKQNAHDTKEKLGAVLDDEYQGKEVVFIAFDKEKTSVKSSGCHFFFVVFGCNYMCQHIFDGFR